MANRQINDSLPIDIPALADIARDQHRAIVIQKSSQTGVSEMLINLALHAADTRYAGRGNALYLLPTTT